jgi:phenylalanyl-tRNA synthetase beta subunit
LAFTVPDRFQVGPFMEALRQVSPLITDITLLDVFDQHRTVRITYSDPRRTLSAEDVRPIREQVIQYAESRFNAYLKSKAASG